jgi:transcriptional activator, Rgg/GadR/MutR family, C-terminal domain
MKYKGYGESFRKIREQKHLGLSYFEKIGVNSSNLSKFERGLTMMSFERVDMMLQEMHITLAEYELILNNFVSGYQEVFLNKIEELDFDNDIPNLKILFLEAQSSGYHLMALIAKSRIERLRQTELEEIEEYLNKVETWGYFELSLIYFVMEHLPIKQLTRLFFKFEEKSENYYNLLKYRKRIFQIAYRIVVIFASNRKRKMAQYILTIIESHFKVRIDFYVEVLHLLVLGVMDFCFEEQKKGQKQIYEALDLLEKLGDKRLKVFYYKRLKALLNDFE